LCFMKIQGEQKHVVCARLEDGAKKEW